MNIFYLHFVPSICAMYHVDKHVVKMILETVQLLCTAVRIIGERSNGIHSVSSLPFLYKSSHINHPSAIWTRSNINNWRWLLSLGFALSEEYTYRYGKVHRSTRILKLLDKHQHSFYYLFSDEPFFPPTPAMPDSCIKIVDGYILPLESYRQYYRTHKSHLHSWRKRPVPEFIDAKNDDCQK